MSPPHRPIYSGGAQHRGFAAILSLALLVALCPPLRADDLSHLQSLISQLGSDDPRLRENALGDLMDLKKQDLPTLRSAALSQSPLLPAQVAALRQVVTQIFLASERYRVDPTIPGGFMGLHWTNPNLQPTPDGVPVDELLPGFPAYRLIQPGDVIVQIVGNPPIPLRSTGDLVRAVMNMWPGDILRLRIRHLGQPINVSLVLDFLPIDLNVSNIDSWIQDRDQKAQAYWNQEFSILEPAGAPNASQASTSAVP
jgi:hypothetical protein